MRSSRFTIARVLLFPAIFALAAHAQAESQRNPVPGTLRTIEFETSEVTEADVAISPDGQTLVFSMLGHLFRMSSSGGSAEQLTFGPYYDSDPVYSPDGSRVAFVSDRDGSEGNIFVLELATGQITQVTREPWAGRHAWSPDGKRIAFESNRDENYEIYVMDTDGSNVQRLTHTKGRGKSNENPDWSPDGKTIAFDSNRDGHWEIYVIGADGSNAKRLTYTPGKSLGSEHAAWSPDGMRIAFDSSWDRTSKNWLRTAEIYVMNADGSNVDRLSNATAMGRSSLTPVWSPDGKKIAFGSNRDGKSKNWRDNFEMYLMDADGSNVQRLTFNQAWDGHPNW